MHTTVFPLIFIELTNKVRKNLVVDFTQLLPDRFGKRMVHGSKLYASTAMFPSIATVGSLECLKRLLCRMAFLLFQLLCSTLCSEIVLARVIKFCISPTLSLAATVYCILERKGSLVGPLVRICETMKSSINSDVTCVMYMFQVQTNQFDEGMRPGAWKSLIVSNNIRQY